MQRQHELGGGEAGGGLAHLAPGPGGWQRPRVPPQQDHVAGPEAGLQYDGAEEEGHPDPAESST